MGLYETLKAAKIGAAPDVLTTLRAQIAPFAKGSNTPTEKELEDTPPLVFNANGEPLIDWSISGNNSGCGDKTAQLFNKATDVIPNWLDSTNGIFKSTASNSRSILIEVEVGKKYTVTLYGRTKRIAFFADMPEVDDYPVDFTNQDSPTYSYFKATYQATGKYMVIFNYNNSVEYTDGEPLDKIMSRVMINEGTTAKDNEPYGYKIPVTCGGETKTIYLDEPLGASDSLSMTDTGITIPTFNGSNTLSVETTVQPSSVYIKYKEG